MISLFDVPFSSEASNLNYEPMSGLFFYIIMISIVRLLNDKLQWKINISYMIISSKYEQMISHFIQDKKEKEFCHLLSLGFDLTK